MTIALRIGILLIWVVLLGLLLGRDYLVEELQLRETTALEQGRETSFAGVYFRGERIGFVRSRLTPGAEDEMRLEQEAYLLLNVLDEHHPVRLRLKARLDKAHLLQSFDFTLLSPFAETRARGRVEGLELLLELDTPRGGVRQERIRLQAPPRIATNQRAYLLPPELAPGDRLRVSYFDPVSLAGHERILEYRGKEREVIEGRIHNLHRFSETFAGMRINVWLNDQGRMVKEQSPAGFVFLAEPEFRATDIPAAGPEILTSVAVPLEGRLPADLAQRAQMQYRLLLDQEVDLDLAQDFDVVGGRQQLTGNILTINREQWPPPVGSETCAPAVSREGRAGGPQSPLAADSSAAERMDAQEAADASEAGRMPAENERPAGIAAPHQRNYQEVKAALAATPHVQSDDPELADLARRIVTEAQTPAAQVEKLAAWVHQELEQRPVMGIPDALSVLETRVGDCNEHATLFAALARAVGLPTRITAGLVHMEDRFYYHAWNEVCLGDQWYSVDTTLNQLPAGLTHIRLITGETAEMVRLGALLGKLRLKTE
ncbi:transglutaminase-like domain-containing protein [Desulfurivibrio dismutans]|uniref:transglutaminase-like domain-containing protein n=1 Tax=Desulfurivibrio dismutans TaxID=1398908 RepID=UPI0023DA3392|nr:transglutaminase-like domain-containing protein [Desulfurivibrio alkaliphilus]MDF1613523.1 transglutaminase-like domain-containing protein [Desulfurivibrio alkaliphilus]